MNNRELFKTMSDWDRWKYIRDNYKVNRQSCRTGGQTLKTQTKYFSAKKETVYDYVRNLPKNSRIFINRVAKETGVSVNDTSYFLTYLNFKEGNPCQIINKPYADRHYARLFKL